MIQRNYLITCYIANYVGVVVLSKEKYQINAKADYICLTILEHDLSCFHKDLCSADTTHADGIALMLRNTRNVFISLHNLKEAMGKMRLNGSEQFRAKTRSLRKKLGFINHVRNKAGGHLDRALLERAAQWSPQLFYHNAKGNEKYRVFESYRAVLESSINSFLSDEGRQMVFNNEIDLLYPPDADQFYSFLSDIVSDSIGWLREALETVDSEIDFCGEESIKEFAAVAGKTNFDLKSESCLDYSEEETNQKIREVIEDMREFGADEKIIEFMESKFCV